MPNNAVSYNLPSSVVRSSLFGAGSRFVLRPEKISFTTGASAKIPVVASSIEGMGVGDTTTIIDN